MMTAEYFDFPSLATEAGLSDAQVTDLFQRTLEDYCGDRMMAELRMLRT
ncbi:hypothetical protein HZA57_07480 [Candidatus Poribacteria bacterium]|nr:hypothetical protein [Candidatus Poribacteria bacterium]